MRSLIGKYARVRHVSPDKARAASLQDAADALDPPPTAIRSNDGKSRVPRAEATNRVRDYLKKHKNRAAKGELSIREVAEETGLSLSSVQQTDPWRAFQDRLEKEGRSKRPLRKKAQAFTGPMDSIVEDGELQELIREQAADDEGSSLDKGRRGRVRVRKRI